MNKLYSYWDDLRSSLWFLPALLVVSAVVLALALVALDSRLSQDGLKQRWPGLFGAGAAGARSMLSAIASSMITVTGVVFSITVVALTLASSQYTSRILRTFVRDRANQTVLGVFTGVYAYCLIVLRTIRGGDEGAFVPSIAVFCAVVLAFVAIGFLIFFIHHIAASIQATSIIRAATDETLQAIDRLFPDELNASSDQTAEYVAQPPLDDRLWEAIPSTRTGYLQGVDSDILFQFACEKKTAVRMERSAGEFVVQDAPIVSVQNGTVDDHIVAQLNGAFGVGSQRTMVQDIGFGIRQIVDVALKALSPGVNDTTTAVTCVQHLTAILARLATRHIETSYRLEEGTLRVVMRGPTFRGLLDGAFDQIRQNASGNIAVLLEMLQGLEIIAGRTQEAGRRSDLRRQADLIADLAGRGTTVVQDLECTEAALERLGHLLGGGFRPRPRAAASSALAGSLPAGDGPRL